MTARTKGKSKPQKRVFQEDSAKKRARALKIISALHENYGDAECSLTHKNPLELLIATILSAQCTDARVNMVTPELFRLYPSAEALAKAPLEKIESVIRSTGFFRSKAKNIKACCEILVRDHGGKVPDHLEDLTHLPGVGRKTANVVLGNAFGIPGMVVDTHVGRISYRLGLATSKQAALKNAEAIEKELEEVIPKEEWIEFSHLLIAHGRSLCTARKPSCDDCFLLKHCPRLGVETSK